MRKLSYKRVDPFFRKIGILILLSSFISLHPIFIDGEDPANDWDAFLNKIGSGR